MRSVFITTISIMALTSCATVSVIPSTAAVETNISEAQSGLRTASDLFETIATSRGWISEQRGLFDLAKVLMDGEEDTDANYYKSYAEFIGADMRAAAEISVTVMTDAEDAADALSLMSHETEIFLSTGASQGVQRADLVAFERALVQAQQTRRSFASAITAAHIDHEASVNAALAGFDIEIDRARQLADQLAKQYSNRIADRAVS